LTTKVLGLPVRSFTNDHMRIDVLETAGPRIVGLFLGASNDNLMAEVADLTIPTTLGDFRLYGGHRLWHAPEATPRSYVPDDAGVELTEADGELHLLGPLEELTGIRKSMHIAFTPGKAALAIRHRLENQGPWPVELAPWALTMLRLGGVGIFPQTAHQLDDAGLLPNRNMVFWPYTRLADPRLHLADELVLLHAQPALPPCKIGYMNRHGWVGYLVAGVLVVKRFTPQPDQPHVDFGCNSETYCNDRFIEVETVGPLVTLEPGQSVEHVEQWELYAAAGVQPTRDSICAFVESLGLPLG